MTMSRDEERIHWLAVALADLRREVAEKHEALVDAEERRAKALAQLDRQRGELDAARIAANAGQTEACAQAIDRLRAWAKEQHEGCVLVETNLTAEISRLRTEIYEARCAAGVDHSPQTLTEGVERLRQRAEKAEAERDGAIARADRLQRENDEARSAAGAACTGQTLPEALAFLRRLANEATDRAERAEAEVQRLRSLCDEMHDDKVAADRRAAEAEAALEMPDPEITAARIVLGATDGESLGEVLARVGRLLGAAPDGNLADAAIALRDARDRADAALSAAVAALDRAQTESAALRRAGVTLP